MPGRPLDALEARRGVHLHDLGPVRPLEHVHAGHAKAHDLGGAEGGPLVLGRELERLGPAAAVDVAAELLALGLPAHGRHDAVAHDERAHVSPPALLDELLDEHVLVGAVQRLDDRLGLLDGLGQDDADALGALERA